MITKYKENIRKEWEMVRNIFREVKGG